MTIKQAEEAHKRTLQAARRVLEVDDLVTWPAGTPVRQRALYGAVVVLTVGAWQGLVEDVALIASSVTSRRAKRAGISLAALAEVDVARFNTPDRANTRTLLSRAGLEFPSTWSTSSAGATLTERQTWEVVDAWIQVRHAVAHGFPFRESERLSNLLSSCPHARARVLTAQAFDRGRTRVLRRVDVDGCIELFDAVAEVVLGTARSQQASL
jgi:hypothetical protein